MATPVTPLVPSPTALDLLVGLERTSRRPRRPVPGQEVHAVPRGDRTRTALCGASVSIAGTGFSAVVPHACPDCAGAADRPLLAEAG